jgi:hypothetical protein
MGPPKGRPTGTLPACYPQHSDAQPNDLPLNYRLQRLCSYVASCNEIVARHLTSPAVTLVNPRTATKGGITNQATSIATSPLMRIIALSLLTMQGSGYLPNNTQWEDIRRGRGLIWATGTLSFTTAGDTPAPAHLDSDYEAPASDDSSSMSGQSGGNQLHDGDKRHTPGHGLSTSNGPAPMHTPPCSTPPRPAPDAHRRTSFYPSPRSPSGPITLGKHGRQDEISPNGDISFRDERRAESGKRTKVDHGHDNGTATSHPSLQSSPRSRSPPVQPVSVSQSLSCT